MDRNDDILRYLFNGRFVALRKESVDRNATTLLVYLALIRVALRKESVDRNEKFEGIMVTKEYVALRKESVDRNIPHTLHDFHAPK